MKFLHSSLVAALLLAAEAVCAEITPTNSPESLRAAILHLQTEHGELYPQARDLLERLESPSNQSGEAFRILQREALVANPNVSAKPILFVERDQYRFDHHNTETMFQTGEISAGNYRPGGALKTVDLVKGETRVIVDPGPQGRLRDPEVRPDGKRIVFSMRRDPKDNYHIYEVDADGQNLHQLTSASGVFDIDPVYLPDGGIIFTSSREPKYCGCNRHIMGNLFRMEADGANIHQLGKSTLFEGHSTVTPDGQILYDRWEYVDRAGIDGFKKVSPKYEDPWPLSETSFLVSREVDPDNQRMGIFFVDTFGNEILLHVEGRGCFDPMPLGPSQAAMPRPQARDYKNQPGTFYVTDVRIGTHMEGVEADEVRQLRVVEAPEKRAWTKSAWGGQGAQAPAMNWLNFENKRILGTVPVEKDGSAYFEVPSDRYVFFQLLDENGMMIQSMRSGTIIQSGESQGCTGCHDKRTESASSPGSTSMRHTTRPMRVPIRIIPQDARHSRHRKNKS